MNLMTWSLLFDDMVVIIIAEYQVRLTMSGGDRSAELTWESDISNEDTSSRHLASRGPLEFKG